MEEQQIYFNDAARRALAEYGMQGYSLEFIRHNEDVTFKVRSPDLSACLLRIHVPVSSATGTHGADSRAIDSELLWLEALNRDTDLAVQEPVLNRTVALVTQVRAEDAALPVNCTLMHWVDGQPYHRDSESQQTARQIGEILAKRLDGAANAVSSANALDNSSIDSPPRKTAGCDAATRFSSRSSAGYRTHARPRHALPAASLVTLTLAQT